MSMAASTVPAPAFAPPALSLPLLLLLPLFLHVQRCKLQHPDVHQPVMDKASNTTATACRQALHPHQTLKLCCMLINQMCFSRLQAAVGILPSNLPFPSAALLLTQV